MKSKQTLSLAGMAIITAIAAFAEPASATVYPWCAQNGDGVACLSITREQCMMTAGGRGFCSLNPTYSDSEIKTRQIQRQTRPSR